MNWQGMLRGAGAGIAQVGKDMAVRETQRQQLVLTGEIQQKRDARLAKYQSEQAQQGYAAQAILQEQENLAKAERNAAKRDNELVDAETAHGRKLELKEKDLSNRLTVEGFIAENNPTAPVTDFRTEAMQKALGEADTALYVKTRADAETTYAMQDSINVFKSISEEFKTGKTQQAMARLGEYLGTDASSAMQMWQGTGGNILLEKMQAIVGVLSDADLAMLETTIPQFGYNNDTNARMIEILERGIMRVRENEKAMMKHLKNHKDLRGYMQPYARNEEYKVDTSDHVGSRNAGAYFSGNLEEDEEEGSNPDLDGYLQYSQGR